MKSFVQFLPLAALGLSLALSGSAHAADRFVQDRFAIGFWVDPPVDAQVKARYKEIADANFSLVLTGFGANDPAKLKTVLGLCKRYGLKALVYAADTPADKLPDHPAAWGYSLRDEPSAADFPALAERAAAVRAAHPGKMAYVNLFPSYASAKALGSATYEDHVREFCDVYKPDVLCMDHYPSMDPGKDMRDVYCKDLSVMRKYALRDNIPFWNFFNCMPFGTHTDPTEGQLRWQMYTSVAYGAKGVLYFCYYTPLSNEFPKGGAIVARDGRLTRHYDQAKRINTELTNLGPTLMKLTSTGVYRVRPDDDPAAVLAGSPIKNLTRANYDPKPDYLIGVFRHEDGRQAVLFNNYHHAYTAWPTVEFACDPKDIVEVSKTTGKEEALRDDSPDLEGLQVSLDAGEGRLFLLPAP